MLYYVLPEEVFIIVPHKMYGCTKSELHRGFFAVFNKWHGLRKSKYISILQRNLGFYSIIVCYYVM